MPSSNKTIEETAKTLMKNAHIGVYRITGNFLVSGEDPSSELLKSNQGLLQSRSQSLQLFIGARR